MSNRDVPPDLCERVGVAVGASRLTMDAEHAASPLVLVAAVGAAANRIALNLDAPGEGRASVKLWSEVLRSSSLAHAQVGTRPPSERDAIEARLAPLLWRMKFGADGTRETALDAVRLFVRWLAGTYAWRSVPLSAARTQATARLLAARVIHEWLVDKCAACGGTGLQELLRNGMTRKPRRFGDPAVRHVACRACRGSTRSRPNPMDRARALQVSLAEYRALWAGHMTRAVFQLAGIARRLKKPLHSELERR